MPRQRHSDRIRSPKVHITYESEAGPRQELPFVVGVIGDFSGDPAAPLERFSEREFTPVKHDDLDDRMVRQMKPGLRLRVKDALKADGSEMMIELKFRRMEDFEPSGIVRQVPVLERLLQVRNRLNDLEESISRSKDFEKDLAAALRGSPDGAEPEGPGPCGAREASNPEHGQTPRRGPGTARPSGGS